MLLAQTALPEHGPLPKGDSDDRERRRGTNTRELRQVFGAFATGVAVVTTRTEDGVPHGATASAFTAVSLDPPLAQVTLPRTSRAARYLEVAPFAINILSIEQMDVALHFAGEVLDDGTGMDAGRQRPGAHEERGHPRMPAVEHLRRRRPHHRRRRGHRHGNHRREPLLFFGGEFHTDRTPCRGSPVGSLRRCPRIGLVRRLQLLQAASRPKAAVAWPCRP